VNDALRQRVLTAVVLAAALLVIVLYLPPRAWTVAVTAMLFAGAWEWSAFLRLPSRALRIAYVAGVGALAYLAWRVSLTPPGREVVLGIGVLWWLAALLWIVFAPHSVSRWSAALAGALALVPAWLALVRLRELPHGERWMLFAFVLVFMADIAAFFFGRIYGRVRLAPEVSPSKTWEGVLGGAAVSAVVAIAGGIWFHIALVVFVPLCLATVGFSVVGDLTESLLKRFAGVKDSGTVFPGHGGVMDRIDSITGAAPVWLLGLTLLGVVA